MAPILSRSRAVLAKIEVTEGTDAVPTGAANAILCSNIGVTPLGGSTADRGIVYPSFGASPVVHVDSQVQLAFDVDIAGSGAAGTAPGFGPLLRMCGISETITAGTKVEYAPISASQESGSIYANESGLLHKLLGTRGTVGMTFKGNDFPKFNFNLTGRYAAPSAVALPTVDYTAFKTPLVINKANTPTCTLNAVPIVLESLSFDVGNKVLHRDRPNAEYVALTDRQAQGTIQFETLPLGTLDTIGIAKANTLIALQIIHGTVAGNIIQLDMTKLQLIQPTYADVDGIRHWSANFRATITAADDDFKLTVK